MAASGPRAGIRNSFSAAVDNLDEALPLLKVQASNFPFNDPTGRHIPATPEDLRAGDVATLVKSVPAGTDLDANSLTPECDSKRPDYRHIAWVLGQFVGDGSVVEPG